MAASLTGRERIEHTLTGRLDRLDRSAMLPIVHAGLAALCGVRVGQFLSDPAVMAAVTVAGYRRFGWDGVQLSLGVTAEAEALGAKVEQPPDGGTILREHLLADSLDPAGLDAAMVTRGGRMPGYQEAVRQVAAVIGAEAWVLATLRGPLLLAAQLRGVERLLMDMFDEPHAVDALLAFTSEVTITAGRWLSASGADGLVLGEATCSPDFISPATYRQLAAPHHKRVVAALKAAGWRYVGLHICGRTASIIPDVCATGVDFMDVDHAVDAAKALAVAKGCMTLRGNLDPSAVFRFGSAAEVAAQTGQLLAKVRGRRWLLSSGCDISPGTPEENLRAFVETVRGA